MATPVVTPTPGAGESALETPVIQTPGIPVSAPEPTQQTVDRQEIYKKYYGEPAPVEPDPSTPVQETPPVASSAPVTPDPVAALQAEIAELRAMLKPAAPAAPPVPPSTTKEELAWAKKLQEGDLNGYEEELSKAIEARIANQIQERAVERAMNLRRVEDDIEQFVGKVRTDNPDLDTPEATHLISSAVERRVTEEMSSNKIENPFQYAEMYKRVLAEEVQRARTFVESIRGAAAPLPNPAIRKEMLSGAGVQPTALPAPGAPSKPALPPAPTAQDYFAARLAASNRGKLLS